MMNRIATFHAAANVAIIGASGGLGQAFVELLAADPAVGCVNALSRRPGTLQLPAVEIGQIDLLCNSSIESAALSASAAGALDLVLVCTGVLHRDTRIVPEKTMRDLDAATMAEIFAINAIGPALVAKYFLPKMRKGHKSVLAAMSARVGSIGDNRLGGWTSYRASKAALNMILKTLSIEQARRQPQCIVVGLHPGAVDTGLSRPFSKGVPAAQLFTPAESAEHLLGVIDRLTRADNGRLFAWDGTQIQF